MPSQVPSDPDTPSPGDPSRPRPNPFVAPRARIDGRRDLEAAPPPAAEPALIFSIDAVILRAWSLYRSQFRAIFGTVNTALMVNVLYRLAGLSMAESADRSSTMGIIAQVAFVAAGVVLQIWLNGGQTLVLLRVARNQSVDPGELFYGGPYVLRCAAVTLAYVAAWLTGTAVCLGPAAWVYWAVPPGAFGAFLVLVPFGLIAWLIAMLVFSVRFNQSTFLIIDQDLGALDALRESFRLTRGRTVELAGLTLYGWSALFAGLPFLFLGPEVGVFAFGLGLVMALPLTMQLAACTYLALMGGKPGRVNMPSLDRDESD